MKRLLLVALGSAFLFAAADAQRISTREARRLIDTILPWHSAVERRPLNVEVDREHGGCTVYHAYRDVGAPPLIRAATLGWWSIDTRTGEVWDDSSHERVVNDRLSELQRAVRKRLRVTSEEVQSAISKPCYERDFEARF